MHIDDDFKKKRAALDQSYFIAKELLMTERTYKKDLELVIFAFKRHIGAFLKSSDTDNYLEFFDRLLFSALDPIYRCHIQFLKELEVRMAYWTDDKQKIGDILFDFGSIVSNYKQYVENYEELLNELESTSRKNKRFDAVYKEFESQKICFLPFMMFLLKPIQRIIHLRQIFDSLLDFYGKTHKEYQTIYDIFVKLEGTYHLTENLLQFFENKQKTIELKRELVNADNLVIESAKNNRYFIREGSLQKLSRKGYQQRMFFLFTDSLMYCAKTSGPLLQFKVHDEYPLKNLHIEDGNSRINIPNSFTIYSSNRSILISAISYEEKIKWFNDLTEAIDKLKANSDEKQNFSSSSENNYDAINLDDDNDNIENDADSNNYANASNQSSYIQQHRANTTMHVCWHRNISVSASDNHCSVVNQLSGYLLRKFKNSNGWQKLWVVYTNFCLFFYKTYNDEFPLASLPLLGYSVTTPSATDNISKDFVLKLQFKNHVYFFRSDSQYSFDRWMDVISSAAQKA